MTRTLSVQSDTLRLSARWYGDQDWHVTNAFLKLQEIEFERKTAAGGAGRSSSESAS